MKFINRENFEKWFRKLSDYYDIFYPKLNPNSWDWTKRDAGGVKVSGIIDVRGHRTALPIKYFFYSPQENLASRERKPSIIFGARGCDVRGLRLLKNIYLDDPEDTYFRKDVLIFSADCTSVHPNCFCTVLGDRPWAGDDFDLNLSCLESGYLVETGSEKGKKILDENSGLFKNATDLQNKEMTSARSKVEETVKKQNENKMVDLNQLKEKVEKAPAVFESRGKTCVSCSACTTICPACFCFFLSEGEENKIRYADSCQLPGYARVAGGANPRKEMASRFKHRFLCKFSYRPEMHGIKGCTGCGRCIAGCQGKINFKEVILEVLGK
ncbi:MAG: 4Fe-4S dicluster domain-containing protein [bacterium]